MSYLKIQKPSSFKPLGLSGYVETLRAMLIAEAQLVVAKKDSAMPHFLAVVKELERIHGFEFVTVEEE